MAAASAFQFETPDGLQTIPVHGAERTITIGGFQFTAHYAFIHTGRPTICFTSRGEGDDSSKLYFAYKSNSEGFWRLAMGISHYYKGTNYITSTFLHMDLQRLFSEIFTTSPPSLPEFPNPPGKQYYLTLYFETLAPKIQHDFTRKNTFGSEREINEPIFEVMETLNTYQHHALPPQSMGGPALPSTKHTSLFLRNNPLTNYYAFIRSPINETRQRITLVRSASPPPRAASPPPRAASPPRRVNSNGIAPTALNLSSWVYRRDPPKSAGEALIQEWLREDIEAAGGAERIGIQQSLNILGAVASRVFEPVDTTLRFAFNTTISYPLSQDNLSQGYQSFPMYVYSVTFRSIMTGTVYTFYIGFYRFGMRIYKHLVFIIPQDSGVYQNGCYVKRVDAGVYIYKPLDYFDQCQKIDDQEICSVEYSFIGMVFQGMWPLTMFDVPPEVLRGGRRRRLPKSKKRSQSKFKRRASRKNTT